jgi:hypothetical protein
MLDFFKDNKWVIGGAVAILLLLGLLVLVFVFPYSKKGNVEEEGNLFGDTSGTRSSDYTTDDFLFGTTSEKWMMNGNIGSEAPLLRALSKEPVAGATTFEKGDASSSVEYARYVSQRNGNIFETPLATVGTEDMVSNEKILRIGAVNWSENALTTMTHYLDRTQQNITTHLRSYLLATSTEVAQGFGGRVLDEDIFSASVSPNGERVFYLKKTEEGTQGYIENVKTGAKKLVWASPLTDLTTQWGVEYAIIIYTNPSSVAEGAVWVLNPDSGSFFITLSNMLALGAKSNSTGEKILYSMQETINAPFSLKVLDVLSKSITNLPQATLIEKCTWGPKGSKYVYCAVPRETVSGEFLENWYMGIVNSDDVIWRIDTGSNTTKKILDPFEETKERFDIEDLVVSPKEDYLIFRTRVNDVLWSLKLPEHGEE